MDGGPPRLVLASASPRRRELITRLGVPFEVVTSRFAELGPGPDPRARVIANARGKAREVARRAGIPDGGVVLGCDTEVAVDGATLGQPADADEARGMLMRLCGRTHQVLSAVVLIDAGGEREHVETVAVSMRPAGTGLVEWYLATGEWRGKAGGYAIQGHGAVLVDGIQGDHSAVVGLPLAATGRLLEAAGAAPWQA